MTLVNRLVLAFIGKYHNFKMWPTNSSFLEWQPCFSSAEVFLKQYHRIGNPGCKIANYKLQILIFSFLQKTIFFQNTIKKLKKGFAKARDTDLSYECGVKMHHEAVP